MRVTVYPHEGFGRIAILQPYNQYGDTVYFCYKCGHFCSQCYDFPRDGGARCCMCFNPGHTPPCLDCDYRRRFA